MMPLPTEVLQLLLCLLATLLGFALFNRLLGGAGGGKLLPPGPWGLPVVGSLLRLDPKKPYETLRALAHQYGPVYRLRLGGVPAVVLAREDLIRTTFAQEAASGRAPLYLTFGIMDGKGLICSEGELWREHRRFTIGVMRALGMRSGTARAALETKILEAAQTTAKELGDSTRVTVVDPSSALLHSLGNSMNLLIFGIAYDKNDRVWLRLQELLEEGSKMIGVAGPINFLPWLRFLPYYRRTIKFIKENQVKSHEVYQKIIERFEATEKLANDKKAQASAAGGPKHFVDAYLKEVDSRGPGMEGSFTQSQLHHVAADLFGAGTETTHTTLRWLLLDLAAHPQQQELVYEEVLAVASESGGTVSTADLSRLVYTQAAMLETQRLHPVVPIGVPHGATKDLQVGGYHVPAGTMLIPLLAEVHQDGQYWEQPDQYWPKRFLDHESGQLVRHSAFMPFQAGRRVCPGEDFARLVLLLYLSQLLLQYRLVLPRDHARRHGSLSSQPGEDVSVDEVALARHVQDTGTNSNKINAAFYQEELRNKATSSSIEESIVSGSDNVTQTTDIGNNAGNILKSDVGRKSSENLSGTENCTAEGVFDEDPFADPICGFTASPRPYKLVLIPRLEKK